MRECEECSACCRWPAVPEIEKPPLVPCPFLCSKGYGCKIYETRPKNCSDYECSWLLGWGEKEDQPDKCGILIDERRTEFGDVLIAKALFPGAEKTNVGQRAMHRIASHKRRVLLFTDDNPQHASLVIGPEDLVLEFKRKFM